MMSQGIKAMPWT